MLTNQDLFTVDGTGCGKIVVVIPAYNEERSIGSVILKAHKYAETIVVVDDGSEDATAEIAEAAGAKVLRHESNRGKGAALNTGLTIARELNPDVVVLLDADGQHVEDEVSSVVKPVVTDHADIVVGSRYLTKKSHVPLHRIFGHQIFNLMINHMSGVYLTDSQSGFRAFSSRALQAIPFHSTGFSVESEMQFLAQEHGLKVAEVPITIHYYGKPKRSVIVHGLMVLNGILRLVGQYRPLLFFSIPGMLLLFGGLIIGLLVVDTYRSSHVLAIGTALVSVLLSVTGILTLFTGFILHSMRGLLLDYLRPKDRGDKHN